MRFLIDENLSPVVSRAFTDAGHDAVHVRDLNATGAPDSVLMGIAADQDRIIVSADTDFGALLASTRASTPSVILVRELVTLKPPDLAEMILRNLEDIESDLVSGAIAAFGPKTIRVRALPIG